MTGRGLSSDILNLTASLLLTHVVLTRHLLPCPIYFNIYVHSLNDSPCSRRGAEPVLYNE